VVVFDDADVDHAVDLLVPYKFRNAGQVCVSPTRFFVQRNIHRRFADAFATRASTLRVGNGLDHGVDMGPLANRRRIETVEAFVEDALSHGAKLLTGGKRVGNKGFFFQPTVLDEVPESARIMSEEPFGPIAPISPFDSLDEVVERANRLPFGLAAYVFSTSAARTAIIGSAIEAGMVAINNVMVNANETPFGGVKESGYGSEAGLEGIEPFLVTKMISEAWRHAKVS
jgi:succinate-semialdehyde dehydrogenase/glutarate-semialdehyde dehydrogenase